MDAQAIVALVGLCLQFGVPAVQAAISAYNQPVVTLEDVKALGDLVKPPETY